jgi:ATPase family protein associated with various cellular activities (AAA)
VAGRKKTAEKERPSQGPLAPALARWHEAAKRLALSDDARAAGAVLLGAELDERARAALLGEQGSKVAPRRCDVLLALAKDLGDDRALSGLVALEARGAAAPLKHYAGPWHLAELELDSKIREHCVSAPKSARASPEPEAALLPRLNGEIKRIVELTSTEPERYLVVIRGRSGAGRDTLLATLAAGLAATTLKKTVFELRHSTDALEPELSGAVAVWDARRSDPGSDDYDIARRWLRRSSTIAVALLDRHHDAPEVDGRITLTLAVDPLDAGERRQAWELALNEHAADRQLRSLIADALARRNQAGPGLARRAVALHGACGAEAEHAVFGIEDQLASLVQPSALRGMLVERPDVQLEHVIASDAVSLALRRLSFLCQSAGRISTRGRVGVKALFAGPSGTGKTMAARALASELRRPLYRVDLAAVVSKWVGETEKNLRDAMAAAEASGAVLLFDEGDALFGKRGEVSKGTDRYANIEVAYLLQALEAFDGVALVTTNLRGNIDEAFERRFDVMIEFTPPDRSARELIWRQELGDAASAAASDRLLDVARRAELNGGSIASAARVARVLALQRESAEVTEEDLRVAVQSEFLKIGSTVQAANWSATPDSVPPHLRRIHPRR